MGIWGGCDHSMVLRDWTGLDGKVEGFVWGCGYEMC